MKTQKTSKPSIQKRDRSSQRAHQEAAAVIKKQKKEAARQKAQMKKLLTSGIFIGGNLLYNGTIRQGKIAGVIKSITVDAKEIILGIIKAKHREYNGPMKEIKKGRQVVRKIETWKSPYKEDFLTRTIDLSKVKVFVSGVKTETPTVKVFPLDGENWYYVLYSNVGPIKTKKATKMNATRRE